MRRVLLIVAAAAALAAGVPPAVAATGEVLFGERCSSCHGDLAQGIRGKAPSLRGVGGWHADFYMRTGRMPLDDPGDQPRRAEPGVDPAERQRIVDYIASFGGPPSPPPADPAAGSLSEGRRLFTDSCAGCHQMVGQGGATTGARIPDLQEATPLDISQAMRMGPYVMPVFSETQIDQSELNSIARYVLWTRDPPDEGGWGIGHIGPIPEGMVTWFIAMVVLIGAIRLIGERTTR